MPAVVLEPHLHDLEGGLVEAIVTFAVVESGVYEQS